MVSTGIDDHLWQVYHPGIYPGHPGPLSRAILPCVRAISTGDWFCPPVAKKW